MDTEDKYDLNLFEIFVETSEKFIEKMRVLQQRPEISSVKRATDFRRYLTDSRAYFFVEAQLNNQQSVCWWLEIFTKTIIGQSRRVF